MHRSRISIVIVAAALTGVLGMAGVAAAARGGSTSKPEGTPTTNTTANTTADTTAARVTTVTVDDNPSSLLPDDHGVDPVGHDANDDHGDDNTSTSLPADLTATSLPDDRRGHDANDDHGDVNDDHAGANERQNAGEDHGGEDNRGPGNSHDSNDDHGRDNSGSDNSADN